MLAGEYTSVGNLFLRPTLGALPSTGLVFNPLTSSLVPEFPITLTNDGVTVTVKMMLDSGHHRSAGRIPLSLAKKLGIKPTSEETWTSRDGNSIKVYSGTIDRMSVPGSPQCFLESGRIDFSDNEHYLLGGEFLDAVKGSIRYTDDGPVFECSQGGRGKPGLRIPAFTATFIHGNKLVSLETGIDTGVTVKSFLFPTSLAKELGLPDLGPYRSSTQVGTVVLRKTKIDRLTLKGISQCWVNGAEGAYGEIFSSPLPPLLGEGFLQAVKGQLRYDAEGAHFRCAASPTEIVEEKWITIPKLPKFEQPPSWEPPPEPFPELPPSAPTTPYEIPSFEGRARDRYLLMVSIPVLALGIGLAIYLIVRKRTSKRT
jgi:hypothetical protein